MDYARGIMKMVNYHVKNTIIMVKKLGVEKVAYEINGNIKEENYYTKDGVETKMRYYENGQLKSIYKLLYDDYYTGSWISYYEMAILKSEETWINSGETWTTGQQDGQFKYVLSKGQLAS